MGYKSPELPSFEKFFNTFLEQPKPKEFPLSQLALVRIMGEAPLIINGQIILETAFQTSYQRPIRQFPGLELPPGPLPRITLHFSLNDSVQDTPMGEGTWTQNDYVVIGGLEATMNQNPDAKLVNLLGADSFFEVPTDTQFVMPRDTVLVLPEDQRSQLPEETEVPIRTYKSKDFAEAEVTEMLIETATASSLPISEQIQIGRNKSACGVLYMVDNYNILCNYASNVPGCVYPPHTGAILENGDFNPDFIEFAKSKGIDLNSQHREYLQMLCKNKAKRDAVQAELAALGYPILTAGADGWTEQGKDIELKNTAKKLGIGSVRHVNTIQHIVEEAILNAMRKGDTSIVNGEVKYYQKSITPALRNMAQKLGYTI